MKNVSLLILLAITFSDLTAQSVGIGTSIPDSSSILELKSTTQGILIPRMTQAQRINIASPGQGLMVYQTDLDTGFYFFKRTAWQNFTNASSMNQNLIITSYLNSDSTLALYDYTGNLIRILQPSTIIDFTKFKIRDAKLSPDGKLIFVNAESLSVNSGDAIFTMDINGKNGKQIITQNAMLRYFDVK